MVAAHGMRISRNDPIRGCADRPGRDGLGPRGPTWPVMVAAHGMRISRNDPICGDAGRPARDGRREVRIGENRPRTPHNCLPAEPATRPLPGGSGDGAAWAHGFDGGPGVVLGLHRAGGIGRESRTIETAQQPYATACHQATTRRRRGGARPASALPRSGPNAPQCRVGWRQPAPRQPDGGRTTIVTAWYNVM